jgi:hypothetical protein
MAWALGLVLLEPERVVEERETYKAGVLAIARLIIPALLKLLHFYSEIFSWHAVQLL